MNVLREIRKVQEKSLFVKIILLLMFLTIFIVTTYAWFTMGNVIKNQGINGTVDSWKVSYYLNDEEIIDETVTITVDEFYPGVPDKEETIYVYNESESSVLISYELVSVRVFGVEILDELMASGEITRQGTKTNIFSKYTDYPFDVSFSYDRNYLTKMHEGNGLPIGSTSTFKFNASWTYRDENAEEDITIKDILDSKFGEDAYEYYQQGNDPLTAIEITVKITSKKVEEINIEDITLTEDDILVSTYGTNGNGTAVLELRDYLKDLGYYIEYTVVGEGESFDPNSSWEQSKQGTVINGLSETDKIYVRVTNGEQYADGIVTIDLTGKFELYSNYADELTRYEDANGDVAYIPEGFKLGQSDEVNKIQDGLVIEDRLGNQYVWVPVETTISGENIFSTNSSDLLKINYKDTAGYNSAEEIEKYLNEEYNNMINSVEKYGGFYVARYETSIANTTVQSQKGQTPYNNSSWYEMNYYQDSNRYEENPYYNTNSVVSSMIWNSQWNAMLDWILSGENSSLVTDTSISNKTNGVTKTGSVVTDVINNIYDLAGNLSELTISGNDNGERLYRGGNYSNNQTATYTNSINVEKTGKMYGSRMALYIVDPTDNVSPTITKKTEEATSNSIKVTVTAQDPNTRTAVTGSGIKKYTYSISNTTDNNGKYIDYTDYTAYSNVFTFEGLNQGTTYDIKVKVYDHNGNFAELSIGNVRTNTAVIDESEVFIDSLYGTNGNGTIYLDFKDSFTEKDKYYIEYQVGKSGTACNEDGIWKKTQLVNNPGTGVQVDGLSIGDIVYARITDGNNVYSEYIYTFNITQLESYGDPVNTKTEVQDRDKDKTVWIPAGFSANELYNEVDEGFVIKRIKDNNGNTIQDGDEFVWVPVDASSISSLQSSATYREPSLVTGSSSQTDWIYTAGSEYDADETYYKDVLGFDTATQFGEYINREYTSMVESIRTYGGFWIGRYETSLSDKEVNSRKNKNPMANVNWYEMYYNQDSNLNKNNPYNGNLEVVASMFWGIQRDAMKNWMLNGNDANKVTVAVGNHEGTVSNTGKFGSDYINNIFDLGSNVAEYSQSAYGSSSRVYYNGYFSTGNNTSMSTYNYTKPTEANQAYGSRLALYLRNASSDNQAPTLEFVGTPEVTTQSIKIQVDAQDNSETGIAQYIYSISSDGGNTYTSYNSKEDTYTFTGLSANTTYKIKVRVTDYAGNSTEKEYPSTIKTAIMQIETEHIYIDSLYGKNGQGVAYIEMPEGWEEKGYYVEYQVVKNGQTYAEEGPWTKGQQINNLQVGDTIYARGTDGSNVIEGSLITYSVDELETFSTTYASASVYTDEDRKTAYIPAGFKVGTSSLNSTVSGGLVIENAETGDQFVWIPVSDGIENVVVPTVEQIVDALSQADLREPSLVTGNETNDTWEYTDGNQFDASKTYYHDILGFNTVEEFGEYIHNEYVNMTQSVQKYGGFYVGRYETSISSGVVKSQYNLKPMINTNWYQMYLNQDSKINDKNPYYGNETVVTSMIWGKQWDAMLSYIVDEDVDSKIVSTSIPKGNNLHNTGTTGKDFANNILDINTNASEFTQYASGSSYRVSKGSAWNEELNACTAIGHQPNYASETITSRLSMYLKMELANEADDQPPTLDYVGDPEVTSNSIKVAVNAIDNETGIREYIYSISSNGGSTYTDYISTENEFIFENLTQNTAYNIKVKVFDYGGNWAEKPYPNQLRTTLVTIAEGDIYLDSLYGKDGEGVAYIGVPSDWTENGIYLEYQVVKRGQTYSESGPWLRGQQITDLQIGDVIYARATDGYNILTESTRFTYTVDQLETFSRAYSELTEYTDSDGRTAYIPSGFKIGTSDLNDTIAGGLVIENAETGDQFVWIPVEYAIYDSNEGTIPVDEESANQNVASYKPMAKYQKDYTEDSLFKDFEAIIYNKWNPSYINGSYAELTASKYALLGEGSYREPSLVTGSNTNYSWRYTSGTENDADINYYKYILGFNSAKEFGEYMNSEYTNMILSVREYGGFYVGRYETSNSSGVAKTQYDMEPMKNKNWYEMYKIQDSNRNSNNSYYGNTEITTSMFWGSQWDAMLNYIIDEETDEKQVYSTSSNQYINIRNTGKDGNDFANNILDIKSNVLEMSQESAGSDLSETRRIARGGLSGNSSITTYNRYPISVTEGYNNIGSRMSLYIKYDSTTRIVFTESDVTLTASGENGKGVITIALNAEYDEHGFYSEYAKIDKNETFNPSTVTWIKSNVATGLTEEDVIYIRMNNGEQIAEGYVVVSLNNMFEEFTENYMTELTEYTDANGDVAYIPEGFKYGTSSTINTVENGLVIKDELGNEFVWVPVKDVVYDGTSTINSDYAPMAWEHPTQYNGRTYYNGMVYYNLDSPSNISYVSMNEYSMAEPFLVGSFSSVNGKYYRPSWNYEDCQTNIDSTYDFKKFYYSNMLDYNSAEEMGKYMNEEYYNMINSVQKYGGFYVGRYETSKDGATAQSQLLKYPTTGSWYEVNYFQDSNRHISNPYYNSKSVVSSMIWNSQWDEIIKWIMRGNNSDFVIRDGYHYNTQIVNTGVTQEDMVNNIFDLDSNICEWTLGSRGSPVRDIRGGWITFSNIEGNMTMSPNAKAPYYGTRMSLYIADPEDDAQPVITFKEASTTTNTMKIRVDAYDQDNSNSQKGSGIKKYVYSLSCTKNASDEFVNYVDYTGYSNTYTVIGLQEGTTYDVKVKVYDHNDNYSEISIGQYQTTIATVNESEIYLDTIYGKNSEGTIYLDFNKDFAETENYYIEYQVGKSGALCNENGTWLKTTLELSQDTGVQVNGLSVGDIVYARITDGTNIYGNYIYSFNILQLETYSTPVTTKTEVTDRDGDKTVWVPSGFAVNELHNDVDEGFVIKRIKDNDGGNILDGDEFVWIPVENAIYDSNEGTLPTSSSSTSTYKPMAWKQETSETTDANYYEGIKYYFYNTYATKSYAYSKKMAKTGEGEPILVTGNTLQKGWKYKHGNLYDADPKNYNEILGFETATGFGEYMNSEYTTMIESVDRYGGFWIGRYETSLAGDDISTTKSKTPATQKSWYQFYYLQDSNINENNQYYENTDVVSSMIWRSQHSAMLNWIVKDSNLSERIFETRGNQEGYLAITGSFASDNIKNIFDLSSNVSELTQNGQNLEYSYGRFSVGGTYNSGVSKATGAGVTVYGSYDEYKGSASTGTRTALYLK